MKKTLLIAAMAAISLGATAQSTYVGQPTDDTWVRSNSTGSKGGAGKNLEMKTYSEDGVSWVTLIQFEFTAPNAGNQVKSATLRLTTRYKKGDSEVKIYPLNFDVDEATTDYAAAGTAIEAALAGDAIATFKLKGYNQWAPTDGAVCNDEAGESFRVVSAWQNTIDLTSYVQTLATNKFAIVLQKTFNQNNSSQIYSKEAEAETLTNGTVFEAADLVPQLTVEYEEATSIATKNIGAAADGWVMDGWQSYSGEIELKNQEYEDNEEQKTDRFYGVMHFDIPAAPVGKKLTNASLRLVTERVKNDRTTDVYVLGAEVNDGTTYADLSGAIGDALAGDKLASFTMAGNNNSIRYDDQTKDEYKNIDAWTNHITLNVAQLTGITSLNLLLDAPVVRNSKNDSNRFFTSEAADFTNEKIGLTVTADKLVPMLTLIYTDQDTTGIDTMTTTVTTVKGIYTLSGQRTDKMGRGLYIVNGKKVVMK